MATLVTGVAQTAAADIGPGYFGSSSALSSGHWVKIKVSETGMQQITAAQLAAWGFDDPSRVAVCGYGGTALYMDQVTDNVPDDLKPIPTLYDGKRLMFYGLADLDYTNMRADDSLPWEVSIRRNYYADYGCYFITDAIDPVNVATVPFTESNMSRSIAYSTVHIDKEEHSPGVGARFFFGDFSDGQPHSFPLFMPGYRQTPQYQLNNKANLSAIHVNAVLAYSVNTFGQAKWQILPGGSTGKTSNVTRQDQGECIYTGQQFSLVDNPPAVPDDNYSIMVDLTSADVNYGALDFINVIYRRGLNMTGGGQQKLILEEGNATDRLDFSNTTSTFAVWDITDPYNPSSYEVNPGTNIKSISLLNSVPADRAFLPVLLAFDTEKDLYTVEKVADVPNQNLHALPTPDMVIVTAPGFLDQAERLADIHRSVQGMDVLVLEPEVIYNEFSSGTPHVTGIRRFLRMLYDRNPDKLKTLLILGGCSYDNRNIEKFPDADLYFVPMYQDQNLTSGGYMSRSYATDAIYGMLSEDFSTLGQRTSNTKARSDNLSAQMEISVGRMPARNYEEGRMLVDKVETYMHNLPFGDTFSRILVSADRGTKNAFMQQADDIINVIKDKFPDAGVTKAYSDFYYQTAGGGGNNNMEFLTRALSRGTNLWYYTGHGSISGFGSIGAPYWDIVDVNRTDYDVPPLGIFATCRSAYYDHISNDVVSTMLRKPNGGLIGSIGSLREVYLNNNHNFGIVAIEAYFTSEPNSLQGDVFRRARNIMAHKARTEDTDSTNIVNTSCYNFIGDPAVPVFLPGEKIKVTSLAGKTSGTISVSPLSPFSIVGTVGPDGEASESFNGEIYIAVYDAPVNILGYSDDAAPYPTTIENDIIFSRTAEVKNGRFDVNITLPVTMRPNQSNRIVLYAFTPDGSRRAVGSFSDLVITSATGDEDADSFAAPVIESMYLDNASFTDGDLVSPNPTLYAHIAPDETGIVGDSPIFGLSMAIIVDDTKTSYNAGGMLNLNPDGSASLAYPISNLSDGPHSLTLRVSNNAGQSTTRTIRFVIVNAPMTAEITVDENPAVTSATIDLKHYYNSLTDTRLIITDMAGNTIYSDPAPTFPYRWNLKDNNGRNVSPGRYHIDVKLHEGLQYGSAVQGTVIVTD